jgi:hypothetical protein
MTTPCQKLITVNSGKCKICSMVVSNIDIHEHFDKCYDNKIKNLFSEFDSEISRIKIYYENKLKIFSDVIHLSDLCKKCDQLSIVLDIEECQITKYNPTKKIKKKSF